MQPTITVDVGTTSVKLGLFGAGGEVLASTKFATPTVRDACGEVYAAEELERGIGGFVRGLDPSRRETVRRIAFAGVGESGALVRPDTSLASPVILWHDHRGAERLAALDADERARVYAVTGLPVNANYGLSKAAWALDRPGVEPGSQWLNVSELLAARLTGRRWSEYSLASRTMALDVRRGTFSAEVCALLGVDVAVFPELRAAREGFPATTALARQWGLSPDVDVHVAGHDHVVGGAGADLHRGELLNSTGTTEGLLLLADEPALDEGTAEAKLANGRSVSGTDFTLFASIPTGGSAFATLQSLLGTSAARLSATVDGLHARYLRGEVDLDTLPLVLPQFRGSPPPTKRATARGIVAGLSGSTTAEDVVLGCFLGMALQFRDVLDLFPTVPDRIKVIGPAGGNRLWQQLKADLLGRPLSTSRHPEVVSRGAQALASGQDVTWDAVDPEEVLPDERRHARLDAWSQDVRPQWEHLKNAPA